MSAKALEKQINLSGFWAILLAAAMTTAWGQTKTKGLVDVNSADVKTLETLPGIGSTVAERIVEGRPYKNLEDLEKVKGLGKSKLDAIQGKITFGSQTATTSKKTTTKSAKKNTGSTESTGATTESAASTSAKSPATREQTASKPVSPTGSSSGKLTPGQTININTATAEELDALPGIGPAKAQAIVDYRKENGRFGSIEDIKKVKGIKDGEFSKIKDSIRVR